MTSTLQAREPHQWQQVADMQARGSGIEARVHRNGLSGQQVGESLRRIVDKLPPTELFEEIHHWNCDLLYQLMTMTRRSLLKSIAATGAGVVAGGGGYGYLYERHALEL